MGHTRQDWEDRIRARLGDHGVLQTIDTSRIALGLEEGLAILASDRPREITQTFNGDGDTYDFNLTGTGDDAFIDRWSQIVYVEYPAGQRIPVYLEARRYMVLPASDTVRLLVDTPTTGTGNVKITYTARYPYPTDTATDDDVPGAWFEAVAALCASRAARDQAVAFARKQSAHVAGQQYERDPAPLFTAAKALKATYDQLVLGVGDGTGGGTSSEIGYAVSDVDVFPNALFHRRIAGRGQT